MASVSNAGFDIEETRARLEDWCLENFAWPIGLGLAQWPGRSSHVFALLQSHWCNDHGAARVTMRDGRLVPAVKCFASPCRVLGVALAFQELHWYLLTLTERAEAEWLKEAAARDSLSDGMREALVARGRRVTEGLISRAVEGETEGRPALPLAQALAQQLHRNGFSYAEVGRFMGCTDEAARKRCTADNRCSFSAVVRTEALGSPPPG